MSFRNIVKRPAIYAQRACPILYPRTSAGSTRKRRNLSQIVKRGPTDVCQTHKARQCVKRCGLCVECVLQRRASGECERCDNCDDCTPYTKCIVKEIDWNSYTDHDFRHITSQPERGIPHRAAKTTKKRDRTRKPKKPRSKQKGKKKPKTPRPDDYIDPWTFLGSAMGTAKEPSVAKLSDEDYDLVDLVDDELHPFSEPLPPFLYDDCDPYYDDDCELPPAPEDTKTQESLLAPARGVVVAQRNSSDSPEPTKAPHSQSESSDVLDSWMSAEGGAVISPSTWNGLNYLFASIPFLVLFYYLYQQYFAQPPLKPGSYSPCSECSDNCPP